MDSRIIPADQRGWIEFDVAHLVRNWRLHPNRNYGVEIEMEDSYGNVLDPSLYLTEMNCSDTNTPLPLAAAINPIAINATNADGSPLYANYPTLSLATVERVRVTNSSSSDNQQSQPSSTNNEETESDTN